MAPLQTNKHSTKTLKELELPPNREYGSEELAELDAALEDAIQKAEEAGQSHIAELLGYELGSLYYSSQ